MNKDEYIAFADDVGWQKHRSDWENCRDKPSTLRKSKIVGPTWRQISLNYLPPLSDLKYRV